MKYFVKKEEADQELDMENNSVVWQFALNFKNIFLPIHI